MRPVDAATLIILRNRREVLMGVRSTEHVFVPGHYVFPGGRVDAGDARVPAPVRLRKTVQEKLTQSASPARARALAMAAVRETFEETGLLLGRRTAQPLTTRSPGWRAFYRRGLVPALDRLDYIARAITPPDNVRRFDARFFLADARHVQGELRGNGELHDLQWVPLAETPDLPMIGITRLVLELLRSWASPGPAPALSGELRILFDSELVEHHLPDGVAP